MAKEVLISFADEQTCNQFIGWFKNEGQSCFNVELLKQLYIKVNYIHQESKSTKGYHQIKVVKNEDD